MSEQVAISDIEAQLNCSFKPVQPDPTFVERLGKRLFAQPDIIVLNRWRFDKHGLIKSMLFITCMLILIWLFSTRRALNP